MDLSEEEDIATILALHAKKRLKLSGSVFGQQKLWRERIEGHNKLTRSYSVDIPIFPKTIFDAV
jgi:hypothetical protein